MKARYFDRIINKIKFNFIPIFSLKDDTILGYKIIKDFSHLGFDDKEYMYQLAYEEGIFEEFALEMLKKAFEEVVEKKLSHKYVFYTLRLNFIKDVKSFFSSVDKIIHSLSLDSQNIVFDIKGVKSWDEFHKNYDKYFKYNIILKEEKCSAFGVNNTLREENCSAFSVNNILKSQAIFIEPRTIDTLAFIKISSSVKVPFIFNLKREKEPLLSQIKALEIDYYYNY